MPGLPIPRLILHHEAATLLCRERSNEDEAEPLTGSTYINMDFDDYVSDEDSCSSDDSSSISSTFSLHIDIESPTSEDYSQVSPLGVSSPSTDGPLQFSHDEVHAFGRTVLNFESTVREAEVVAKKTFRGAEKVARQTAKKTGKLAKQTARRTTKVAKKTAKNTTRVAKKTAKGTERVVKETANYAVGLPHELSSHWFHLVGLILLQSLVPVAFSMVSLGSINHSVNDGLSENRGFLYGTHTLMDIFILAPFVSTCHYAMPDAEIPLQSRIMAVVVGLVVGKIALAFIAEAWWSPGAATVFPVPFSFVVTMVASVPSALFTLWKMTPKRRDPTLGDKIKKKFRQCFYTLGIYICSFLACCAWAINFRRLVDSPWRQAGWSVLYQVMEFIFKILIAANLTTRLNGKRWLQLNSVVDLIFASVQTAMLPYFASWISVMISVAAAIFTISWRSYAGVDRLQKFLPKAKEVITSSSGPAAAFKGIGGLAAHMTTSPVKDIAPMASARLIGNRGLPEWDIEDDVKDLDGH